MSGDIGFNTDQDSDGSTDNEVLASAKQGMDVDLLLIRFHGIDDTSHKFAPHSKEALAVIAKTDKMVQELCGLWDGYVIVVADHGQHQVVEDGKKGNHGEFWSSDMFIPLLTREAI